MCRAAVPEAAVHVNGDLRPREDQVGSTPPWNRREVDSVAQPEPPHSTAQGELGLRVTTALSLHPPPGFGRRGRWPPEEGSSQATTETPPPMNATCSRSRRGNHRRTEASLAGSGKETGGCRAPTAAVPAGDPRYRRRCWYLACAGHIDGIDAPTFRRRRRRQVGQRSPGCMATPSTHGSPGICIRRPSQAETPTVTALPTSFHRVPVPCGVRPAMLARSNHAGNPWRRSASSTDGTTIRCPSGPPGHQIPGGEGMPTARTTLQSRNSILRPAQPTESLGPIEAEALVANSRRWLTSVFSEEDRPRVDLVRRDEHHALAALGTPANRESTSRYAQR